MIRACATLGAANESRIGSPPIQGRERKKHMASCDDETPEVEVELIFGRIGRPIEDAEKTEGITKRNSENETGRKIETTPKGGRGRSLSKRRKEREREEP